MTKPLVSIIIRTKNEERWIGACLRAIFQQNYPRFEVIVVDNKSTDQTVAKARAFDVRVVTIDEFLPGKAINLGARAAAGDILVCLSGHCIPVDPHWLENLVEELADPAVAGVYGRQQPMSFSSPFDKRDLMLVFGLDRKVQVKDSFFHNANSAVRRDIWQKFPFDEDVTNIEDRLWGKQVISQGLKIVYAPDASVYHYHGIHQGLDPDRAASVVRIMESIDGPSMNGRHRADQQDVLAIVPVRGALIRNKKDVPLLWHTLQHALTSTSVGRVVVSTDNAEVADYARSLGAEAPFLRPDELSENYVDITQVLAHCLSEIERDSGVPDLVVTLSQTMPFRPFGLIDTMIAELLDQGLDTIVAAKPEWRQLWLKDKQGIQPIGDVGFMPRELKDTIGMIGLFGLGCVTHPVFLRSGSPFGSKLGIHEVHDAFASVEIRDAAEYGLASGLLKNWHSRTYAETVQADVVEAV